MINYEEIIKITKYELKGELPDTFRFENGERVKTRADWERRRQEIYKKAVDLQFGTIPTEKPDVFRVEPTYLGGKHRPNSYRIIAGTKEKQLSFTMYVFKAETTNKTPMVITGDLCFPYPFDTKFIDIFLNSGIGLVAFNRTELAPDIAEYNFKPLIDGSGEKSLAKEVFDELDNTLNCGGPLKEIYPEYTFGAIGAWAWGYSRCVDALELLGIADMEHIAFTGHSRGAKTAALAGVIDERAFLVNPNATCAGGCSCYRVSIEAITEDGDIKPSEPISNILNVFPAWMGEKMHKYSDKEELLPFDSHDFKALVAPRILFVSEAASDIWSNPVGSYQTTEAAAEVYKFLGCEENLLWYFRRGYHYQKYEDIEMLVNIINNRINSEPLSDKFFKLPFKPIEKAYSWKCPEVE